MRTGSAPEPGLGPHWAARQLSLNEDTSPAAARAAFLRRLPADDFVPPPQVPLALAVLDGREPRTDATPARALALCEEERRLRHEVDVFTAEFFLTPVSERQQRWRSLRTDCTPHPALLAWLDHLEGGLSVESVALSPEQSQQAALAEYLRELFVLRPAARAARRRAILRDLSLPLESWQFAELESWQFAASELRRWHEQTAALDNDLLLNIEFGPLGQPAPMRRGPRSWKEAARARAKKPAWTSRHLVIVAICVVLGGLGRLFQSGQDRNRPTYVPPTSPTPEFKSPAWSPNSPYSFPPGETREAYPESKFKEILQKEMLRKLLEQRQQDKPLPNEVEERIRQFLNPPSPPRERMGPELPQPPTSSGAPGQQRP